MSEHGPSPNSPESGEFDKSSYPERISGRAMPSVDAKTTEVEITDSLGEENTFTVPEEAVQRLNMPRLSPQLPEEVKAPFEAGIGVAMISCRVEDQQEGLTRVILPTIGQDTTLIVKTESMVRKVN